MVKKHFLLKHKNLLRKKYQGRYIAVIDDKIVSSGKDRLKVYREASKKDSPNKKMSILYFPLKKETLSAL